MTLLVYTTNKSARVYQVFSFFPMAVMTLIIGPSLVCLLNYFKHGSRSATELTLPLYPSASAQPILALALQSSAAIPASSLLFLLAIIPSGVIQALSVLLGSMALAVSEMD